MEKFKGIDRRGAGWCGEGAGGAQESVISQMQSGSSRNTLYKHYRKNLKAQINHFPLCLCIHKLHWFGRSYQVSDVPFYSSS